MEVCYLGRFDGDVSCRATESAEEVEALMELFVEMLDTHVPEMHERGVRVRFLGRRQGIPEHLARRIADAEALGANTVLDTRFATSFLMQSAAEILVYGTAVVVEDV